MSLVEKVIIPSCVWSPGKASQVLRESALSCFYKIVTSSFLEPYFLQHILMLEDGQLNFESSIIKCFESLMADDIEEIRLIMCHIMSYIFAKIKGKFIVTKQVFDLYPNFIKRLDEINDEVRLAAVEAIYSYLDCIGSKFLDLHLEKYFEEISRALFIHLDDDNEKIRKAIYDILLLLSNFGPELLINLASKAKFKNKNSDECSLLIEKLKDQNINK